MLSVVTSKRYCGILTTHFEKNFTEDGKPFTPKFDVPNKPFATDKKKIIKKVNTRENTRGSWLTELEIQQIRNDIQATLDNERNQPGDQPIDHPEADNRPENLQESQDEPPEEQQRNEEIPAENRQEEEDILKIKEELVENYANSIVTPFEERVSFKKPNKNTLKTLKNYLGKVNKVLEDVALLTDICDVNQLNNLTYAAAITAINDTNAQNNCTYRKANNKQRKNDDWVFNMKRRIDNLRGDISRILQMRGPNPSAKIRKKQ